MTRALGAHAPTQATPAAERRTLPIELLPIISSYGGGASYPTSFVGDSEPSVGLSDPGAALRLAARIRGLDSAEFAISGTGSDRRRSQQRITHQQHLEQQQVRARERAREWARQDDEAPKEHINSLSPIGLM